MYSTIFQIETSPVEIVERIDDDLEEYENWFVGQVANYVTHDSARDESIEDFRQMLAAAEPFVEFFTNSDEDSGFVIRAGFREAYFKPRFTRFQKALQDLSEVVTLEAFSLGELDMAMYELQCNYNDRYGYYVESATDGLLTLDEFLRCAKIDTPYYFGGTVRYHF